MAEGRRENDPACFGDIEKVFPMGEDGLRKSPDSCMLCSVKTECLRTAMSGRGGVEVRGEKLDRSYKSGNVGFLERWSRKKHLSRELDKKRKNV